MAKLGKAAASNSGNFRARLLITPCYSVDNGKEAGGTDRDHVIREEARGECGVGVEEAIFAP